MESNEGKQWEQTGGSESEYKIDKGRGLQSIPMTFPIHGWYPLIPLGEWLISGSLHLQPITYPLIQNQDRSISGFLPL